MQNCKEYQWLLFVLVCFVLSDGGQTYGQQTSKLNSLPRSTPESQGVTSLGIKDFIESADQDIDSMHSFMLLRNGHVVAEAWWKPESAEKPHVLFSLSKSFTSTAVGFAVAEQKLSIDDRVSKFFPDDMPDEISGNLKSMRVKDLLTMSSGHSNEVSLRNEADWVSAFLAHPVPHQPGTHFQYNTPGSFMLSAIIQKVTGQKIQEYLQKKLFNPLGIKKPRWNSNPQGITIGGYGLYLTTEDIAKFGQLYLQKGKWEGKQLISPEWVTQATSKQVANGDNPSSDWNQGYGFQFWMCRHEAFRGDGKDGQFCIVMPNQNAVVVMTANTGDLQGQLNLVWDKLLPAMHEKPLPENKDAVSKLHEVCAGLKASK